MADFIYLASQSPRRRQLLEQLGVRYELLLPDSAEDTESLEAVYEDETPFKYVQRVTALKLDAALIRRIRRNLPSAPILCADTTVALKQTIFGKPDDAAHAERMLSTLVGQPHQVLTAVAVQNGPQRFEDVSTSQVYLQAMTASQIKAYVASGESAGKAGAYAIQGRIAMYISRIEGSHSGIMGLPLWETASLMQAAGLEI